ncbi:MAG: cya 5 [Microvirga sp.]|jgi:hypothetical protein|nr:cya 5 [Microvirga sp.]
MAKLPKSVEAQLLRTTPKINPDDLLELPDEFQPAAANGEVTTQAVTASFSIAGGVLTGFGDSLNNTITLSRDAAGKILVNGGAVAVLGGPTPA